MQQAWPTAPDPSARPRLLAQPGQAVLLDPQGEGSPRRLHPTRAARRAAAGNRGLLPPTRPAARVALHPPPRPEPRSRSDRRPRTPRPDRGANDQNLRTPLLASRQPAHSPPARAARTPASRRLAPSRPGRARRSTTPAHGLQTTATLLRGLLYGSVNGPQTVVRDRSYVYGWSVFGREDCARYVRRYHRGGRRAPRAGGGR